jgi:PRC-barrel domain protein
MTTREWVGHTVLDRDGEQVGRVDQLYRDQNTDRPTWAVVKSGLTRKERFVPLADASEEGDGTLRIGATKDQVDDAPDVPEKDRLTPEDESRLHRHYSEGAAARAAGSGGEPRRAGGAAMSANGTGTAAGPDALELNRRDRERHEDEARSARRRERDRDRADDREGHAGRRRSVQEARERQHREFGGFNWGAAFFGWLVAVGIAVLLTAIASAAGTAVGLTKVSGSQASDSAGTIGLAGGIALLVILMVAYFAGGYVGGRLSRFDGGRQGFGVWVFGLIVTIALAVAGAVFGSKYNVLEQLNLPRIPVDEGTLATGGLIALAAVVIGTLLAALFGGKTGERYHKKVDRAAY